jgi:hypothetical protein
MYPGDKRVRCRSGLMGTQNHLRAPYASFEEFEAWSETYGLHTRLGFETPQEAWAANPIVQSSVEPSDFRVVRQRVKA